MESVSGGTLKPSLEADRSDLSTLVSTELEAFPPGEPALAAACGPLGQLTDRLRLTDSFSVAVALSMGKPVLTQQANPFKH